MSDRTKTTKMETGEEEQELEIIVPQKAIPQPPQGPGKNNSSKKDKKLKLETVIYNARPTRNELYNKMKKEEGVLDQDVYEFASPLRRGLALVIDACLAFLLVKGAAFVPPLVLVVINFFLQKYELVLDLPLELVNQILHGMSIFCLLFLVIVLPGAFFNVGLGKKLCGLRVRGENKYTLTITQAFQRELIFKPISVLLLVGLIMPFFTKKKQSLHDKMAETLVIKE